MAPEKITRGGFLARMLAIPAALLFPKKRDAYTERPIRTWGTVSVKSLDDAPR